MKTTLDDQFHIVDGVVTRVDKVVYEDEFTERLMTRREITENGCWLYTGYTLPTGQGQINRNGKRLTTNRAAYELFIGPIPKDLFVSLSCNNNSCFNPNHLVLLTRAGNFVKRP